MMKLWLDDVRLPPEGWVWCKTAVEAIEVLATGEVEEASLDHDLGCCEACTQCTGLHGYSNGCIHNCHWTGYTVVKWMAENNVWPETIWVHSANPVGAANMQAVIDRYKEPK